MNETKSLEAMGFEMRDGKPYCRRCGKMVDTVTIEGETMTVSCHGDTMVVRQRADGKVEII